MLLRVLWAESLKLKRTPALWMAAAAPLAVVFLSIFVFWQMPSTIMFRGPLWTPLAKTVLGFWAILMMPLYLTLETALLAGFEHSENQWKSLLALPVRRWHVYVSKLMIVGVMLCLSGLLLALGIALGGMVLPVLQPELRFDRSVPWADIFGKTSLVNALAFPSLAILHWVSLRWRSFSAALGVGMVATLTSFVLVNARSGWEQYYPWAMPVSVLANRPVNAQAVLLDATVLGLVLVVLGCWESCRRELE